MGFFIRFGGWEGVAVHVWFFVLWFYFFPPSLLYSIDRLTFRYC